MGVVVSSLSLSLSLYVCVIGLKKKKKRKKKHTGTLNLYFKPFGLVQLSSQGFQSRFDL